MKTEAAAAVDEDTMPTIPTSSEKTKARYRRYDQKRDKTPARVAYHRSYWSTPDQWIKHALSNARKRAKKYGLDCTVTAQEIFMPSICPVFGTPFVFGGRSWQNPSLDRIDNSKGYVAGNVHVISMRANTLKSDATIAEFERLLQYMRAIPTVPLVSTKESTP